MRVVVPVTDVRTETLSAVEVSGWAYDVVDVSDSDESYWSLLAGLWSDGETFCIVEQDIVVGPATLTGMAECASPWCACPYPYFVGLYAGLGCAKFGSALLRNTPGAIERVGAMSDATHAAKHWCRLDAWLQVVLHQQGARRCIHASVGHLRPDGHLPYPAHGCVAGQSQLDEPTGGT